MENMKRWTLTLKTMIHSVQNIISSLIETSLPIYKNEERVIR
jgi:hypothetical protein